VSHKSQEISISYVDALYNRSDDRIHIVERIDGQRVYKEYPVNYIFYYDDPKGKFKSIFDTPVSRFSSKSNKEFHKELRIHSNKAIYESDFNPIFRCLEDNYKNIDSPTLNVAFFDIEVDFHPVKGFSPVEDPFNMITAISVYLGWMKQLITLVIPPKHMSSETAQRIANQYENTIVFEKETDLLNTFLDLIDDADILSGWNSEGYDIPYTVNRVTRVLSKNDTRRFCLWGQFPKERKFERYGAEQFTYDICGRVHMDSMQLYRKYTYEERHSYSLDAIAEYELGERKIPYEGTLDQLYNRDFPKFIEYNRQDTLLLAKLDEKLKFIDLANAVAHENTVLLQTAMGAVAMTEQAIINEAHERGMVIPNRIRNRSATDGQAAGAYVAYPRKGIHRDVGSIDINSLYPSVLRALNMGPETIIGQLRSDRTDKLIKDRMADKYINGKKHKGASFAGAWEGLFASLEYTDVMNMRNDIDITIDWYDGSSDTYSASDVWTIIFDSNRPWALSANGTIFTYERESVIAGLLKRWYAERKELQKNLRDAINKGDKKGEEYWDKRQLVKKINLNSLYGAILNIGCRFFDKRIGQSTTLTGRCVAKHMDAYVNECITGVYDHVGDTIIYGDTDSCYFSAWPVIKNDVESGKLEWNKDVAVALYDSIAEQVNESFPPYMERAFHCPPEYGDVIRGGREIVASSALFIKKKRYAVLYYDKDGKRYDSEVCPGKVKAMGLDLKRSDTPKVVQDFLTDILHDVLTHVPKDVIVEKIKTFKLEFEDNNPWYKGTPKRVNNLTKYSEIEEKNGKSNMPGHVRAALNWNTLRKLNNDNSSAKIVDGMKTIVCKLKDNPLGWTSIAYPIDEAHLPWWFTELPFDADLMESTIVDKKVENLLGVLDWNLETLTDTKTTLQTFFNFT
jgi:DNA polymerase elongation subunit (family B)